MGWDQSYSKDDFSALFEKITGLKVQDLLTQKLSEMGIVVTAKEEIVLTEDMYLGDFKGEKVHLNDGRIFQHKLAATYHSDDQGHDHYGWFEQNENPEITRVHPEEPAPDPNDTQFDDGADDDQDIPVVNWK